jgi:hypothetical protein
MFQILSENLRTTERIGFKAYPELRQNIKTGTGIKTFWGKSPWTL